RFAGVLLQMRAREADALFAAIAGGDAEGAALHDRLLVLADLVALRQVRVEVVLWRKDRGPVVRRADREAEADRMLDCGAVQDRQHPRQGDIDRGGLRIGLRAEGGRRGREDLALRQELRVRLDADDDFPAHGRASPRSSRQWPRLSMKSGSR